MAVAFLDIKGAYDTVCRPILWRKCKDRGMSTPLLSILTALFEDSKVKVRIADSYSDEIPLQIGLMQGSSISPCLYTAFIDDLVTDLEPYPQFCLGSTTLNTTLYADDIAIIGETIEDLQRKVDVASRHARANKYRFGIPKCEVIANGCGDDMQITMNGEQLKVVKGFKYLGILMGTDGVVFKQNIGKTRETVMKRVRQLKSIGISPKTLSMKLIIHIFNVFIRPILEYGVALSPIHIPRIKHAICGAYYNGLLSMLRIDRMVCRTKFDLAFGLLPYETRLQILRTKFSIECTSLDENSLAHQAYLEESTIQSQDGVFYQSVNMEVLELLNEHAKSTNDSGKIWERVYESMQKTHMERLQTMHPEIPKSLNPPALVIDGTLDSKTRMLTLLWTLNRLPYAGEYCQQCEYLTLSKRHLEEHHGDKLPLPGVRGQKLDREIQRSIEHEDNVALIRSAKWIKLTSNACIPKHDQ